MKEDVEKKHGDNSAGVVGVVFGILSLVFAVVPIIGPILGIIGVIFSFKQRKNHPNRWSTAGLWMCWIGIIVGAVWSTYYIIGVIKLAQQYQQQLQALQQGAANGAGGADLSAYGAGS